MIYVYIISFLLFCLVVYLTSGSLQFLLWKWFGKNISIKPFNGCKVYLSDNLPIGLQGRFFPPDNAFVKRSYFTKNGKKTNIEFVEATIIELEKGYQGTNDTIQHEAGGHREQYLRYIKKYTKPIGIVMFYGWGFFNGVGELIGIYKKHSDCPIEREPNEWEKT